MRKTVCFALSVFLILSLAAACTSSTMTGSRTSSTQTLPRWHGDAEGQES